MLSIISLFVNDMIRLLDTYESPWLHFFYYFYNPLQWFWYIFLRKCFLQNWAYSWVTFWVLKLSAQNWIILEVHCWPLKFEQYLTSILDCLFETVMYWLFIIAVYYDIQYILWSLLTTGRTGSHAGTGRGRSRSCRSVHCNAGMTL